MDEQQLYMALLVVYENNFRGLHWKLAGPNFHTNHLRFGDYYEKLGEFMDETAEQMIIQYKAPVSAQDALKILEADTETAILVDMNQDYDADIANKLAMVMFNQLYTRSIALAKSDSIPADVADVYMDHSRYYSLEAKYKLARTLNDFINKPDNAAPGLTEENEPAPMNEE